MARVVPMLEVEVLLVPQCVAVSTWLMPTG